MTHKLREFFFALMTPLNKLSIKSLAINRLVDVQHGCHIVALRLPEFRPFIVPVTALNIVAVWPRTPATVERLNNGNISNSTGLNPPVLLPQKPRRKRFLLIYEKRSSKASEEKINLNYIQS